MSTYTIHNGTILSIENCPPIRVLIHANGYLALAGLNVVASGHLRNGQLTVCIYEKPTPPESVGCVDDTFLCQPTQDAFLDTLVANLPNWVRDTFESLPPMARGGA